MSNVAIVKKMYDDFRMGDFAALAEALHPDIEWAEPELEYLPYTGLTKGRDNVIGNVFPNIAKTYEKLVFIPDTLIDGGDVVTVMGPATAKGPYGDEEHFRFAHVVRLEDGKVIRFDHFVDTHKIARTLGAEPSGAPSA